MSQIARLRARLKNVQKNVTEYRMTVTEARALLAEIDNIPVPKVVYVKQEVTVKVADIVQTPAIRILDGGSF